jgi:hypothetical protein
MAADLRRLVNAFQISQALHVAAVLGIADLMADGAQASDELAEATGTHPGTLYRLLRALASVANDQRSQNVSSAPTSSSRIV